MSIGRVSSNRTKSEIKKKKKKDTKIRVYHLSDKVRGCLLRTKEDK